MRSWYDRSIRVSFIERFGFYVLNSDSSAIMASMYIIIVIFKF